MKITIKMSEAVACALSFDDLTIQNEYRKTGLAHGGSGLVVTHLKRGYKLTADARTMERVAYLASREDGWDLPPQSMYTCNLFAKKIMALIAETPVTVDENGEEV